ncbi:MAG: hypothetical protein HXS46_03080 [Theionarchaea archaeon]|nr:hypothetical protein [Theionarchaea archaeon]
MLCIQDDTLRTDTTFTIRYIPCSSDVNPVAPPGSIQALETVNPITGEGRGRWRYAPSLSAESPLILSFEFPFSQPRSSNLLQIAW